MKTVLLRCLAGLATFTTAAFSAHAAVVITNLDPSSTVFGENAPIIGQSILTSSRPITLSSVQFLQTGGLTIGETAAVYSRNADGSVGSSLFNAFTLAFDNVSDVTTATTTGSFTLQANTGYYFVLNSNSTSNLEWSYTDSTDYASAFGVTLPATDTRFFSSGTTTVYASLSEGPQEFQVNGTALPAVPEPSFWGMLGLGTMGAGFVALRRRRHVVGG